jgi:hypothetical protein
VRRPEITRADVVWIVVCILIFVGAIVFAHFMMRLEN